MTHGPLSRTSTVRRSLLAVVSLPVALGGIVAVAAALELHHQVSTVADLHEAADATHLARDYERLGLDMQLGALSYLFTRDPADLARYRRAAAREHATLDPLEQELAGEPRVRAELEAAKDELDGWKLHVQPLLARDVPPASRASEVDAASKDLVSFRAHMETVLGSEEAGLRALELKGLRRARLDIGLLCLLMLGAGAVSATGSRQLILRLGLIYEGALARARRKAHQQEQTLAALGRSEASFREVLTLLPDGIAVHRAGRNLFVNETFARMLGHPQAAALKGRAILDFVPADEHERVLARVRAFESSSAPEPELRTSLLHASGRAVPVEVRSWRISFDGELAIATRFVDTLERDHEAARMVQLDRLAAMGTLSAGVAHEINNPLAFIISNLAFIDEELRSPSAAAGLAPPTLGGLREALADSMEGAQRIRQLVKDLKGMARSDDPDEEHVDLQRAMETAAKLAHPVIKGRATVVRAYQPVPPVRGGAGRLQQVFLNLIVNAAQALPDDARHPHEIRLGLRVQGQQVVAEVADTGSGIPPEVLDRIFEPFFTTKPPGEGTGLGLSISRQIVTGLGGDIAVESVVGRGTQFRVMLPASA